MKLFPPNNNNPYVCSIGRADFDGDGEPDDINFMIKRIKVHTTSDDPGYRYPGNYGVEKFLELFSGNVSYPCLIIVAEHELETKAVLVLLLQVSKFRESPHFNRLVFFFVFLLSPLLSTTTNTEEDYNAFCLAYMFTYRDFEGGTLGLAWTGDLKNAGGVCEKNGVSQLLCNLNKDEYIISNES